MLKPDDRAVSEPELLKQFRSTGDPEVLGRLFTPLTGMVYGVCLKYLRDRDDAKDAVMQVFEKLMAGLRQHDVLHFKSWLYATTRNHCLMQLRAKKGKFTQELSADLMETPMLLHQEEEPELEDNLVKLENCIKTLAMEQQACVRQFYLKEMCYKDICTLTGFDLNKVKSHIQNGKRNLRLCMERNG